MATNRLAVTQVPIRRSFKSGQEDNANAPNCDIEGLDTGGQSGYKARSELSEVERACLNTLDEGVEVKRLFTRDPAILLKGPQGLLETWPFFFRSKEESGVEMQQGFVAVWSNLLIAETLLATISIQPLVMMPNIAHGWKFQLYKYIWMISTIFNLWGIAVTALFLGYVLGCPNKVVWKWMCEIPSVLVILNTILTLVATTSTCWILYGYQMGIVCAVVEIFYVVSGVKLATVLDYIVNEVTNNMQYEKNI